MRDMVDTDRNFIHDSFVRSFWRDRPMCWVAPVIYFKSQGEIVKSLMHRANVLVACVPEDPNTILGYSIHQYMNDVLVLHYLYDKLHGHGVRERLLQAAAGDRRMVVTTHAIPGYKQLRNRMRDITMEYDPFLLKRLMSDG